MNAPVGKLGGDDQALTFVVREDHNVVGRVVLSDAWGLDGEEVALLALASLGVYRPASFSTRGDRHQLCFSEEGLAIVVEPPSSESRRFVVMEV